MTHHLLLTPRDPVIARDGRPFGLNQGRRMRSLSWVYPSVVAGALRTALGKATDSTFPPALVEELKEIEVAGPFPWSDGSLFLPAPHDFVRDAATECYALRPAALAEGEGADLPDGLRPVVASSSAPEHFKHAEIPAWWSVLKIREWLLTLGDPPASFLSDPRMFRQNVAKDERTHLEIDSNRGAAKEGLLFTTTGLVLDQFLRPDDEPIQTQLAVRVGAPARFEALLGKLNSQFPLGGERRLVHWAATADTQSAWDCPAEGRSGLQRASQVRMVLVTPAVFRHGWRPGWLNEENMGSPPGANVNLRLVGVCNRRWRAVSGYSLEHGKRGPKPIRRLVPAGGVYFFEVESGDAADLADQWLRSVSDKEEEPYRRDGFGLAVWGVW